MNALSDYMEMTINTHTMHCWFALFTSSNINGQFCDLDPAPRTPSLFTWAANDK